MRKTSVAKEGSSVAAVRGSSFAGLARRCSFAAVGLALGLNGCGEANPGEHLGGSESGLTADDKIAFDYFLGKGLTNFQAAGIVGNLDQESGMRPTAVQSGGPGRGIAQWSVGGRWDSDAVDNATWYAGTQGKNVWSLALQLDFVWYELTTFPHFGLATLQQSTDVTGATVAFENHFEGCGKCAESKRIAFAQAALSAYGADIVDGGPPASDAGSSCFVTALGVSGECLPTSACAALKDSVSTPGYCPGAADIECCTATSHDAGGEPSDSGTRPDGDLGDSPPADGDAASAPKDPASGGIADGCAMTSRRATRDRAGVWLSGLALMALGRRRARRRGLRQPGDQ